MNFLGRHPRNIAVFVGALLASATAGAQRDVLSSARQAESRDSIRAIVVLDGGEPICPAPPLAVRQRERDSARTAEVYLADVRNRARRCSDVAARLDRDLALIGGAVKQEFPMFHMCSIAIPRSRLAEVRALDNVRSVWLDSFAPSHLEADPEGPPTDPVPLSVEHHRAETAHQMGFTGAGSTSWAPVMAILDGWLKGEFNMVARHHAALHQSGTPGTTRVLADLDWNVPPTPLPMRPLPVDLSTATSTHPSWTNVYHGLGVAGLAAGAAVPPGVGFPFSNGHAPESGLVSMNILKWHDAMTTSCGPQSPGYWAYQTQVIAALDRVAAMKYNYSGSTTPERPILVVNLSYGGPPNPTHPTNEALRRIMACYGILPITSAGNTGNLAFESLYNVNGLAVAAYQSWFTGAGSSWSRAVDPTSTRGPLNQTKTANFCAAGGDADASWPIPNDNLARQFPDIGAIGSTQQLALQDDESGADFQGGTSTAAPHVTGAALLTMVGKSNQHPSTPWTALETRAALIATTENAVSGGLGDNTAGSGFLRTDRVTYARALNDVTVSTTNVVASDSPLELTMLPVQSGGRYAVAIAWIADADLGTISGPSWNPNWADFDLIVTPPSSGPIVVGSVFGNRTWERLEFTASTNGTAKVEISTVRPSATWPDPVPVALATARVDMPGAPFGSVVHATSTNPVTCQVNQVRQPGPGVMPVFESNPANFVLDEDAASLGYVQNRVDHVWVAFKFDGTGLYPGAPFCTWQEGTSPISLVTKVRLATVSPRERVVRCMLVSGQSGHSSRPLEGTLWNRWEGWARIPSGFGFAEAEFYAESASEPPRWFCVLMPPDVLFGDVKPQATCGLTYIPFGNGVISWSADSANWSTAGARVHYDLEVYGLPPGDSMGSAPRLRPGIPRLAVTEPPSMSSGKIEFLLTGGEQGISMSPGSAVDSLIVLADGSSTEVSGIGSLYPNLNGTCVSIMRPSPPTVVFNSPPYLMANTGTGTQTNPAQGPTSRLVVPVAPDAALLGVQLHWQVVQVIPVGAQQALRPSSIESIALGF